MCRTESCSGERQSVHHGDSAGRQREPGDRCAGECRDGGDAKPRGEPGDQSAAGRRPSAEWAAGNGPGRALRSCGEYEWRRRQHRHSRLPERGVVLRCGKPAERHQLLSGWRTASGLSNECRSSDALPGCAGRVQRGNQRNACEPRHASRRHRERSHTRRRQQLPWKSL